VVTPPPRLLVLVAALALVASACTQAVTGDPHGQPAISAAPSGSSSASPSAPSATPSAAAPTPAPADYTQCPNSLLKNAGVPSALAGKLEAGCAKISVPLDYSHPSGRHITISIVRVHDVDNTHPTGSLLINPGGPGASGIEFTLGELIEMPVSVVEKFDLIGFDPRGVGGSSPIKCLSNAQKDALLATDPDVTTTAGLAAAKAQSAEVAHACEAKYGSALPFYNTENTARDMDQIRQAVGDKRMNYLGFSYGTELGWVYAHLFPKKMRAIVLDGAVDPDSSDIAAFAAQMKGFELAFDQFAANCKTVSPCDQLSDPRQAVSQIAAAARAQPLTTSTSGRKLTEGLAYTGVLQALYSKQLWPRLATSLISARQGDGTGLLQLADIYNERSDDGTYTNVEEANTTIGCNDTATDPSDATVKKTAAEWAVKYPMFGRWSASGLVSCQSWQPDRTPVPKPQAATPTKVLVIGNLHDPATPYKGAEDLTKDLGNAELLSWDGAGHTSYLQGSTCIDTFVNDYLLTQHLPPQETTCPS
jgi:pimeloyl-ACP methyl ester carboxylesterase